MITRLCEMALARTNLKLPNESILSDYMNFCCNKYSDGILGYKTESGNKVFISDKYIPEFLSQSGELYSCEILYQRLNKFSKSFESKDNDEKNSFILEGKFIDEICHYINYGNNILGSLTKKAKELYDYVLEYNSRNNSKLDIQKFLFGHSFDFDIELYCCKVVNNSVIVTEEECSVFRKNSPNGSRYWCPFEDILILLRMEISSLCRKKYDFEKKFFVTESPVNGLSLTFRKETNGSCFAWSVHNNSYTEQREYLNYIVNAYRSVGVFSESTHDTGYTENWRFSTKIPHVGYNVSFLISYIVSTNNISFYINMFTGE